MMGVQCMRKRAGECKTNLAGEAAYKSFTPAPLPPSPPITGFRLDASIA